MIYQFYRSEPISSLQRVPRQRVPRLLWLFKGAWASFKGGIEYPEGPSTQYSRTLVPNTISSMVFGTRNLKSWVLGLSGVNVERHFGCLLDG